MKHSILYVHITHIPTSFVCDISDVGCYHVFDVFEVVVLDAIEMFDILTFLFAIPIVLCDFMLTSGLARKLWVQLVCA